MPEWVAVGILGKLLVRGDGTCQPEATVCRVMTKSVYQRMLYNKFRSPSESRAIPDHRSVTARLFSLTLRLILLDGKLHDHNDKNKQCNKLICTHGPTSNPYSRMALSDRHLLSRSCLVSLIQNMRLYMPLVLYGVNN